MRKTTFVIPFLVLTALFLSCSESKEDFERDAPADYLPLTPGKFRTYRLDSLVFPQAGRAEETHYYQEKHVVDAQITDNLGRPSYRIFRFLRDTAGTQPWQPNGSYFITLLEGSAEVIDDNMRIIKLVTPIKEGTSWRGNTFLGDEPYASKYTFSNDDNMEDWEYLIEQTGESVTVGTRSFNDVLTVSSIDESLNAPVTDPRSFGTKSFSLEKYAKGVGLVQQELTLWEYQPNTGGTPYKIGFGVKRRLMDYN